MTIELNDKSYIVGVWFSYCPITRNNWMACVIRDPENKNLYKGFWRFEYITDDDNEKSWTAFTSEDNQTQDDMIAFVELAQKGIEEGYPEKDKIIIKGNLKKMIKLSKNKPWLSWKSPNLN